MSVYKEAFKILDQFKHSYQNLFADGVDEGIPVIQGDSNWKALQHLVHNYRDEETPIVRDGNRVYAIIEVIDEWAVSDGVKTVAEATFRFRAMYTRYPGNKSLTPMDGYITID